MKQMKQLFKKASTSEGAGASSPANEVETPALGVEDIPGAVIEASPAAAEGGEGMKKLRDRLAAFRSRQTGAGAEARAGGGAAKRRMGQGGAGGGRAEALRAAAATGSMGDPIAMGRRILDQLTQRLGEDTSNERKPLRNAVLGITRGYDALEQEVEKLRGELNLAHEAVRAVQGQSD
ncbi:MAG: hypothetical protein L0387_40980 [Acidobacteria bacterium]|nr:hypothetical protein [Acidobacteriota bacterium]